MRFFINSTVSSPKVKDGLKQAMDLRWALDKTQREIAEQAAAAQGHHGRSGAAAGQPQGDAADGGGVQALPGQVRRSRRRRSRSTRRTSRSCRTPSTSSRRSSRTSSTTSPPSDRPRAPRAEAVFRCFRFAPIKSQSGPMGLMGQAETPPPTCVRSPSANRLPSPGRGTHAFSGKRRVTGRLWPRAGRVHESFLGLSW